MKLQFKQTSKTVSSSVQSTTDPSTILTKTSAEDQAEPSSSSCAPPQINSWDKQFLDLKTRIEAIEGLIHTQIQPDGNCLFRCMAEFMNDSVSISPPITNSSIPCPPPAPPSSHLTVRKSLADFIKSNPDIFQPFIEIPIDIYAMEISSPSVWGGEVELTAFSLKHKCNIYVFQEEGTHVDGGSKDIEIVNWDEKEVKVVCLAYHGKNHYNYVKNTTAAFPSIAHLKEFIQQKKDEAIADMQKIQREKEAAEAKALRLIFEPAVSKKKLGGLYR
jgi:OTU-like cysteine protease